MNATNNPTGAEQTPPTTPPNPQPQVPVWRRSTRVYAERAVPRRTEDTSWGNNAAPRAGANGPARGPPGARGPPPPSRKYGTEFGRELLVPGAVIYTALHNSDFDTPTRPTKHQTLTYIGVWAYSKKRKFIIVARYDYHFIAIPIYTHEGRGLDNPRHDRNDWIGVRDSSAVNPPPSESNHANLIYTRCSSITEDPYGYYHMHERSHAHLTHPVSFNWTVECELEGNITPAEDVARLVKLYYKDARKEGGC
ncbi:hypothetical protein EG329_009120 [Mollisiaceae sp. DMI_Dod_QoI]|nr:hypothetical protein EG329_009120 [Helotiales sp. DMI_Dod_QoI]